MEKVGKCALCGREGPLSYEHTPPREAFNDKRVRTITGDDYLKVIAEGDMTGAKYMEKQRGQGEYSLCPECNSLTGGLYGKEYVKFVKEIKGLMRSSAVKEGMELIVDTSEIYPLRIIKQIISMFCSVNQTYDLRELREFVLNRDLIGLSNYRVGIWGYVGNISRSSPFVGLGQFGKKDIVLFSEIVSDPIGIFLVKERTMEFPASCCDITCFAQCNYNFKGRVRMEIPIYRTYTAAPGIVDDD